MNSTLNPLVSIIIPVYQVEKYLDKCITSVTKQTYTNLEIILVDDGSIDNCPVICDSWKERDSRIRVIHQKNSGLSVARNEGMKLATGEFIGFVDSDDWIEPNMYEILLTALWETEADIAVGGVKSFTEDSQDVIYTQLKTFERTVYSAEEALWMLLLVKKPKSSKVYISCAVWNKLFRRTIISDIVFPEGKLHEDIPWTAQAIGNSKTVACVNQVCYHYLIRPDSLSRDAQKKVKLVYDELEMYEQRLGYFHEHYPELVKFAVMRLHNFCCKQYLKFCSELCHLDADGKIRNDLYQHFCQYRPRIFLNIRDIPKNIARILFWISPKLLVKLFQKLSLVHKKKRKRNMIANSISID